MVVKDEDGAGSIEVPGLGWTYFRALELSLEKITGCQHKAHRQRPIRKSHPADSLCGLPVLYPKPEEKELNPKSKHISSGLKELKVTPIEA